MVLFKSCPRCGTGDLVKAADSYGIYVECVQCGFHRDLPVAVAATRPAAAQPAPVAGRRTA